MNRLHDNRFSRPALWLPLTLLALVPAFSACASAPSTPVKSYDLDICIVTDNKLGSMGDPVVRVYGDQEVKFCCKPCVKKYEADPDKFLAKLKR